MPKASDDLVHVTRDHERRLENMVSGEDADPHVLAEILLAVIKELRYAQKDRTEMWTQIGRKANWGHSHSPQYLDGRGP